jgi:hypothetical protein
MLVAKVNTFAHHYPKETGTALDSPRTRSATSSLSTLSLSAQGHHPYNEAVENTALLGELAKDSPLTEQAYTTVPYTCKMAISSTVESFLTTSLMYCTLGEQ